VPNKSKVSLSWSPTIPADDKENAPLIVSQIILDVLEELIMTYPKSTEKRRIEFRSIKKMTYKSRAGLGVPGKFCTSVNETNWYGRSLEWHEESGIHLSRS
jgi:hypothetical protein